MDVCRHGQLFLLLSIIYFHSTVTGVSLLPRRSSATASQQKIEDKYEPDSKQVDSLEENLRDYDGYNNYKDFKGLENNKKSTSLYTVTVITKDEENAPETSTDFLKPHLENPLLQKLLSSKHTLQKNSKLLIIPIKLRNRQKRLKLLIDKALKPKFKPNLLNNHNILLGKTHKDQNKFDGENSEEMLRNILNLNQVESEMDQDYFKNALLTKSKVYNITKMPKLSLQKGYYIHKKENISVDLRHSNTNYSDTHIITLETIVDPDKSNKEEDITEVETSDRNEIKIQPGNSNKPDYPTDFVGGVFLNPNQPNFKPSSDSSHPVNPSKIPTDFIAGTFVDEQTTESRNGEMNYDKGSEELENNDKEPTLQPINQEKIEGDTNNFTMATDKPSESGDYFDNSDEMMKSSIFQKEPKSGDYVTEIVPVSEMSQQNVVTEFPNLSNFSENETNEEADDLTTIIHNSNDEFIVEPSNTQISTAQNEHTTLPSKISQHNTVNEFSDMISNSGNKIGKEVDTLTTITNYSNDGLIVETSSTDINIDQNELLTTLPSEMSQQNVVTEFSSTGIRSNSENETDREGYAQTTFSEDLNDGLIVEPSNTYMSVDQNEPLTTLPKNEDVLKQSNDIRDETEEDSLSDHDVELYAGKNSGQQTSNNFQDGFIDNEKSTTEELKDDINMESTTEHPYDEYLTELCLPLMNYKNVSLYSLLSGNFFLKFEGNTIPLELGEDPLKSCHSGTEKCKLHLKLSNSEKNQSNKNESENNNEDKATDLSHNIKKRHTTDDLKFKINNGKIVNSIKYSTNENIKPYFQLEHKQKHENKFVNTISNINSKVTSEQGFAQNQNLKEKEHMIHSQTNRPVYRLTHILKRTNKSSRDFPHMTHVHDNTEDVGKRYVRSIHSAKSETEEGSSCGCKNILGNALAPIPPYDHFLGKRLDILTNIAHAVKDWFVSTS